MALRLKNLVKKKLARVKGALRQDLQKLLEEGSLAEAVERYRHEMKVDPATAAEVVMSLQCSEARKGLVNQAKSKLGELEGLLKNDLQTILHEGETTAAVEWCCMEAGIDPEAARVVVSHLQDETPQSLRDKTMDRLEALSGAARQDACKLLQEGKAVEAIHRLEEEGMGVALATALVGRLRDTDPEAGRDCLIGKTLNELTSGLKADLTTMIEDGHLLSAVQKVREESGLDLMSARDVVDRLRQEQDIADLEHAACAKLSHLEKGLQGRLRELVARGEKLAALKLCHEEAGLTLGMAAAVVEALVQPPNES